MSWFNASQLSSFAKQALSQAQKSIDRVLDIQEEEPGAWAETIPYGEPGTGATAGRGSGWSGPGVVSALFRRKIRPAVLLACGLGGGSCWPRVTGLRARRPEPSCSASSTGRSRPEPVAGSGTTVARSPRRLCSGPQPALGLSRA